MREFIIEKINEMNNTFPDCHMEMIGTLEETSNKTLLFIYDAIKQQYNISKNCEKVRLLKKYNLIEPNYTNLRLEQTETGKQIIHMEITKEGIDNVTDFKNKIKEIMSPDDYSLYQKTLEG